MSQNRLSKVSYVFYPDTLKVHDAKRRYAIHCMLQNGERCSRLTNDLRDLPQLASQRFSRLIWALYFAESEGFWNVLYPAFVAFNSFVRSLAWLLPLTTTHGFGRLQPYLLFLHKTNKKIEWKVDNWREDCSWHSVSPFCSSHTVECGDGADCVWETSDNFPGGFNFTK